MKPLAIYLLATTAALADLPGPITDADYRAVNIDEAKLGQLLFWDPILSGNRNISCGTCHHPDFGTSDGLPLGVGEGGVGLGPARRADPANPPEARIPRNAPALFNLGAHEFTVMFHDGRVEEDGTAASGMRTPMDDDMLAGFTGVLSAQTMFPVLSADEMAGQVNENDISRAVRQGLISGEGGAWSLLASRVAAIPSYRDRFSTVYADIAGGRPIGFPDISNAIAVFIAHEWRSDRSPLDAVLRGETTLAGEAADGMALFYGDAGCSGCHSGPFQTDHGFHAMAAPQIGPGKAASFESHQQDTGRMRVTGNADDAFAFRTPSLRNVAQTAPYGHAGAMADLAAFLRHHADPRSTDAALALDVALPPGIGEDDFTEFENQDHRAEILDAVMTPPVELDNTDIDALVAFLKTLSDPAARAGRLGVPETVPSGLPVDAH